MLLKS